MAEDDLDIFLEQPQEIQEPEDLGTRLVPDKQMTKEDLNASILRVYKKLGGDEWLLKQAEIYPTHFLNMMKPLISNSNAGNLANVNIIINSDSINDDSHENQGVIIEHRTSV